MPFIHINFCKAPGDSSDGKSCCVNKTELNKLFWASGLAEVSHLMHYFLSRRADRLAPATLWRKILKI